MAENTDKVIYGKVKKFIDKHKMFSAGDTVVAGVSGGADSVCLLHLLWRMQAEYRIHLLVVHINHGVREDAAEDARYVSKLCERLQVPFYLKEIRMEEYAREHRISSEEAGRILRYKIFEQILAAHTTEGQKGKIAVAHNGNDRAETMLFHLFRGSGLKGVSSIQPVREQVVRPVLCLTRAEIEAYLQEAGLTYQEDSTNAQDTYTRNKIRHHILPYAEAEICQGAITHMGELADIFAETEAYMEMQTRQMYDRCVTAVCQGLEIQLEIMKTYPAVLGKRLLLLCLEELTPHRKDITGQHIVNLMKLLNTEGSKMLFLPYGLVANKEYDRMYLGKMQKKDAENTSRTDEGEMIVPPAEVTLPSGDRMFFDLLFTHEMENIPQNRYTKWFDYDKITTSLSLRRRMVGDYLTVDEALHRKSVKEYMINEKIPKLQRDSMHILADGSHVLWIPGYRISQYYKVDENTKRILQVRFGGGSNGGEN